MPRIWVQFFYNIFFQTIYFLIKLFKEAGSQLWSFKLFWIKLLHEKKLNKTSLTEQFFVLEAISCLVRFPNPLSNSQIPRKAGTIPIGVPCLKRTRFYLESCHWNAIISFFKNSFTTITILETQTETYGLINLKFWIFYYRETKPSLVPITLDIQLERDSFSFRKKRARNKGWRR